MRKESVGPVRVKRQSRDLPHSTSERAFWPKVRLPRQLRQLAMPLALQTPRTGHTPAVPDQSQSAMLCQMDTTDMYGYVEDISAAVKLGFGIEDEHEDISYSTNDNSFYSEFETWRNKSVKSWSGDDIVHWISCVAYEINVCPTDIMAEKFSILDGFQLSNLKETDFGLRDPNYGTLLYRRLQPLLCGESVCYDMTTEYIQVEEPLLTTLDLITPTEHPSPPPSPTVAEPHVKKGRGRPRLPRRKKAEKLGRVWEFLRDILKNPTYCPSIIAWENHDEGIFRFVHSEKVAKLWGSKRENPDMDYPKFSRAMRYCYGNQLLQQDKRRLVYRFGPLATNWRVDNPNFSKML